MTPSAGIKFPNMLRFLATVRHQLQEEGQPAWSSRVENNSHVSKTNKALVHSHRSYLSLSVASPALLAGVLDLIFGQAGEGSKKQPKAEKTQKLPQKELFEVRLF